MLSILTERKELFIRFIGEATGRAPRPTPVVSWPSEI